MLDLLTGAGGLVLPAAAAAVAVVLEVVDERRTTDGVVGRRVPGRTLRLALVVLVLAAVAATVLRLTVLGD